MLRWLKLYSGWRLIETLLLLQQQLLRPHHHVDEQPIKSEKEHDYSIFTRLPLKHFFTAKLIPQENEQLKRNVHHRIEHIKHRGVKCKQL